MTEETRTPEERIAVLEQKVGALTTALHLSLVAAKPTAEWLDARMAAISGQVGRCGAASPALIGDPPTREACKLPHGHAGWHLSDTGGEWAERVTRQ